MVYANPSSSVHHKQNIQPHGDKKTIAIVQIVAHPALDAVREGIIESLTKRGYHPGENIHIISENAQGNMALASQIANKVLSEPLAVAVAISTPSAQTLLYSAIRNQKNVPIVFAAVSDPKEAKLLPEIAHYPITGIADTPHLEGLLEVIQTMLPNTKTLGVIYNPGESNSVSAVRMLKGLLKNSGITLREATVNATHEVGSATQSMVGKVDALYFPQDNTVVSAIDSVVKVVQQANIELPVFLPIFTNDPVLVQKGVLAAVGYDYRDIGRETGSIIADLLDGKSWQDIPIKRPSQVRTVINGDLMKKWNISIPKKFRHSTVEVISSKPNRNE